MADSYPRVEASDTHQFIKNFVTTPLSVAINIYNPVGTLVTSLATASQSGSSANWYYFYTTTSSYYTTVNSSGMYVIEWVGYRATGNDIIRDYFEVIKTD